MEKWAVVEQQSSPSLPGLCNCLITLPTKRLGNMAVIIRNETEHDVVIPQRTVIAELHAIQQVIPHKCDSRTSDPEADQPTPRRDVKVDFGDASLSAEWKEKIIQKLNSMPEVFAHHDLDFGHTGQVKHHIKLQDQTPFKQRARPIHPQDVDAVGKHLRELLDADVS